MGKLADPYLGSGNRMPSPQQFESSAREPGSAFTSNEWTLAAYVLDRYHGLLQRAHDQLGSSAHGLTGRGPQDLTMTAAPRGNSLAFWHGPFHFSVHLDEKSGWLVNADKGRGAKVVPLKAGTNQVAFSEPHAVWGALRGAMSALAGGYPEFEKHVNATLEWDRNRKLKEFRELLQ